MRRILKALLAEDMVELRKDKTYALGARNVELGRKAIDQNCLLRAVDTDIAWLSKESQAMVYLGVPIGNEFIFIAGNTKECPVGSYGPYNACSIAKAYLANTPEKQREQIIGSTNMQPLTQFTTCNAEALQSELNQAHQDGYSHGSQQMVLGEKCFGACIFDATQTPCAGIGFSKSLSELDQEQESKLVAALVHCRDQINQKLMTSNYEIPSRAV